MQGFDPIVANPGRLRILTALAAEPSQPFVYLRGKTGLTDGNLATHVRRLAGAGLIAVQKELAGGKPLTTLHLTKRGREALSEHVDRVISAMRPSSEVVAIADTDDDWVD